MEPVAVTYSARLSNPLLMGTDRRYVRIPEPVMKRLCLRTYDTVHVYVSALLRSGVCVERHGALSIKKSNFLAVVDLLPELRVESTESLSVRVERTEVLR